MSGRHAIPSRFGKLYREVAKFGLVGASGFVVNLGVFNIVTGVLGWPPVRAGVLATAVAILTNYLGLRYFTYRDRDQETTMRRRTEMGLFLFFSAIGLVIENGVLYVTTYGLGLDGTLATNVCKFFGIGVATLFRFWSYRTWVFRAVARRPEHPEPVARGGAATAEPVRSVPWETTSLEASWETR